MLESDDMALSGTSAVTGPNIKLFTTSAARPISIGAAVGGSLSLEEGELQRLTSSGTVTIGEDTVHTGGINIGGGVDLSGGSFDLTLATDGNGIDAGATKTINVTGQTLTLDAKGGIGTTNAISFTAAKISAVNKNTGTKLMLAPTGSITLGGAGATIDQQVSGGFDRRQRRWRHYGGRQRDGVGRWRLDDHAAVNGDHHRYGGRGHDRRRDGSDVDHNRLHGCRHQRYRCPQLGGR